MRTKAESKTLVTRNAPSKYNRSTLALLRRLSDVFLSNQPEGYSIEGRTLKMKTATLTNVLGRVQRRQLAVLLNKLKTDGIVTSFSFEGDNTSYVLDLEALTAVEPASTLNKREKKLKNVERAAKAREAYAADRQGRRLANMQALMGEMRPLFLASVLHPQRQAAA